MGGRREGEGVGEEEGEKGRIGREGEIGEGDMKVKGQRIIREVEGGEDGKATTGGKGKRQERSRGKDVEEK